MSAARLTFGSLFAGVGGIDLGLERAGLRCTWQVEIDPKCSAVLARHWPEVERYEDVRECGSHNLPAVDLVAGGFPCQPVSVAGKRRGRKDERWLWPEFYRVIRELKPRWALVENVVGLLSADDGRLFGGILRDLARSGYDAEWRVLSAAEFGAPHQRNRLFLVAHTHNQHSERYGILNAPGAAPAAAQPARWLSEGTGRWVTDGQGNRRTRWIPDSSICRVADGIPGDMDELRMLGNAVVPQVAEWIGRRIVATEAGL